MHSRSLRPRIRLTISLAGALLVLCCSATAASAAVTASSLHLGGTWSGKYSGAYSGTFKIHWTQTGSRLTGSITLSNPGGRYSIDGKVKGTAITFGAVGAGATYTGSVSGTSMSGHYKTGQGGGAWSAHKTA
jgi:hypothetical protein